MGRNQKGTDQHHQQINLHGLPRVTAEVPGAFISSMTVG